MTSKIKGRGMGGNDSIGLPSSVFGIFTSSVEWIHSFQYQSVQGYPGVYVYSGAMGENLPCPRGRVSANTNSVSRGHQ